MGVTRDITERKRCRTSSKKRSPVRAQSDLSACEPEGDRTTVTNGAKRSSWSSKNTGRQELNSPLGPAPANETVCRNHPPFKNQGYGAAKDHCPMQTGEPVHVEILRLPFFHKHRRNGLLRNVKRDIIELNQSGTSSHVPSRNHQS
jgi:hypothetical protein